MRSSTRSSRSRFGRTFNALAVAVLGALPALLIASSARASGSSFVEDWTMGVLLLAFCSMLVLVTMLGKRLSQGLASGSRLRSDARGER